MKLKNEYISKEAQTRLHNCKVPIIALTGGIASGKSTASSFLTNKGLKVICADQLIKNIYKEDATFQFISSQFPTAIVNNSIDFKILRKIAFEDQLNRQKLEDFLYLRLPEHFNNSYSDNDEFIIYDVPLLFEKKLDSLIDYSLLIYTPFEIQVSRLIKRDNISNELAREILANQLPIDEKRELANHIIENSSTIQALEESLNSWLVGICE